MLRSILSYAITTESIRTINLLKKRQDLFTNHRSFTLVPLLQDHGLQRVLEGQPIPVNGSDRFAQKGLT